MSLLPRRLSAAPMLDRHKLDYYSDKFQPARDSSALALASAARACFRSIAASIAPCAALLASSAAMGLIASALLAIVSRVAVNAARSTW